MYAVLHIADFALHAVLRTDRGAQPERAAALFDGTRKKSLALAVNAAARRAGVDVGMTAPQAMARCPGLCIRTPDTAAEAEARAALLATGFLLSPTIEDTAPGVCTIDLRGADWPATASAAENAVAELARLDLPATAGIARTPLLALYAARSAGRETGDGGQETGDRRQGTRVGLPLAGRPHEDSVASSGPATSAGPTASNPKLVPSDSDSLTTRNPKPHFNSELRTQNPELRTRNPELNLENMYVAESADGYGPSNVVHVIVDEKGFLAPLPLATAEPPPVLADVFASWGLRTLGEFTALPRDEIVRRFGSEGLRFWQRANGGEPRPLRPVAPPQEFAARLEFEEPVETLEPLLFILRRFLDRLALQLRAAHFLAAELALTLALENGPSHARSFRLPEPTAGPETLFRALFTHLESLHTDSAIIAVQLLIVPSRPLVRQQGLFETGLRDPHGFAETLARVVAMVGNDRVGTPQLEDTHRPDAVKMAAPAAVVPPPAAPPVHAPLGLPLRRYRPPLPVTLELTDGRPTFLSAGPIAGAIAEVRGPWRSSGDWWQTDRVWQRIEYDVALAGGGLYRLLLIGDAWVLEGEYD